MLYRVLPSISITNRFQLTISDARIRARCIAPEILFVSHFWRITRHLHFHENRRLLDRPIPGEWARRRSDAAPRAPAAGCVRRGGSARAAARRGPFDEMSCADAKRVRRLNWAANK
ncbi:hypothetical protein E4F39_28985 [Burkholderia pseudomallei]|nr:hypothetical protein [Burkholderia pseudomallei]MPT69159.1 hypothetical protein [Burkholderia pseudomallei]MPT76345.1 hypothetical protein [Burkholderia pseudomallei]MPT82823.1 hypothetical protein [Burkholderia pseudomallei]MPT90414.1 hypothetical protein [Burkholderia pseudomallei]